MAKWIDYPVDERRALVDNDYQLAISQYYVNFTSSYVRPGYSGNRKYGYRVRLVTEVK